MKKTITLLSILTLTAIVFKAEASKLYLRTASYESTAFISGQQFYSHRGEFIINDIRPGNHSLSITRRGRHGSGRDYGRREYNYHRARNTFFRGRIFIPEQSIVYARITSRGGLIIDQVIPIRIRNHRHSPPRSRRNKHWEHDYRRDYRSHRTIRTQSNFDLALDMTRSASFESEKLGIAKQYVLDNRINSQQVLMLMNAMNYESSKLEIAKFAYRNTVDPQNYFIVNKGFDFSSSINALNRHIR